MTPEEWFKQRVKDLMNQPGCNLDQAFSKASDEVEGLANQADRLQNIKHQIEWEMRFKQ